MKNIMKTQVKFTTKKEAHRLIDGFSGNRIYLLNYDCLLGLAKKGKYIRKKKGKRMVDKALALVLCIDDPVVTLNIYNSFFLKFNNSRKNVKSIVLSKC